MQCRYWQLSLKGMQEKHPTVSYFVIKQFKTKVSYYRISSINRGPTIRDNYGKSETKKCMKHEEVHWSSDAGSNRRVDIIAFDEGTRSGFVIDPTVRTESSQGQDQDQARECKHGETRNLQWMSPRPEVEIQSEVPRSHRNICRSQRYH
jgi:hypothetical protein